MRRKLISDNFFINRPNGHYYKNAIERKKTCVL